MQLIQYTTPRLLIADEGMVLRDKNDLYKPAVYDEQGNLIEEEHKPYYTTIIFPASQIGTLEKAKELYVEEKKEVD